MDSPWKEIDYVQVLEITDLFRLLIDIVKAKYLGKRALTGKICRVKHIFIINTLHFSF